MSLPNLTPTHVIGIDAERIAAENGWTDAVCLPFTSLNPREGVTGNNGTQRIIYVTPGRYDGINAYLGTRRDVTVFGPREAIICNTRISTTRGESLRVFGISCENTSIGMSSYATGVEGYTEVGHVRMYGWKKEQSGVGSPTHHTRIPSLIYIHDCEFEEVGGTGNTTHTLYIGGRYFSTLIVEDCVFNGARGCSAVKSTCNNVFIRRNKFYGVGPSGMTIHTPIDVVAASQAVISYNEFHLFRPLIPNRTPGYGGTMTAAIFIRQRKNMFGCDMPVYPDVSWDPPVSSETVYGDPGGGFSGGPETFVSDEFWNAVASHDRADPDNPFTFKHFIGFNKLVILPDSRPIPLLRDDGTYTIKDVRQFGPGWVRKTHPNWQERSVDFLFGNEIPADLEVPYEMDKSEYIAQIEEGAVWPRTEPHQFPLLVHVKPLGAPPWFRR